MGLLNKHPFPVQAYFEKSVVLGFAVPKEQLEHRIPECLELDLFDDRLAFIAVAIVQTKELRPKGFPRFLGRDFMLIGYRIFVRYRGVDGRRLRGLYILGSETEKASMQRLGSIFTQYRYNIVPIEWASNQGEETISSSATGFHVRVAKATDDAKLPIESPFANWREARRFAGPMPFTFSYEKNSQEVIIVEGVRSSWTPAPLTVVQSEIPFIDAMNLEGMVLANAFIVEQVPYHWKRGRVEKWTG